MDTYLEKIPVNLKDFKNIARNILPGDIYDYLSGGAGDEITINHNEESYNKIALCPRVLREVGERDLSLKLLSEQISMPICIAPTAFHCLANKEGELATVRAAAKANTVMIVSMASTMSLEEISKTAFECSEKANPKLWFQMYLQPDITITKAFVKRAEDAGYKALVVTADSPVFGHRERDIRNGFHQLPNGLSLKNFDAVETIGINGKKATLELSAQITWKDIETLISITKLPVFIKGIMCSEDAELAIQHGVDGIIVSNHGGRQLDTVPPTIEVLPKIASTVNGRVPVIVDGGIRRGTDVLKALALGADAIAIGRPILWGLASNGEKGVSEVLKMLKHELDISMALCGCSTLQEINKSLIYSKRNSFDSYSW